MYYNSSFINKKLSNGSSAIYSAILKYGYSNFSLDILEYCEKDVLIEREQYYIDTLNPKYNILKIAGSRTGFKHSEKTKALISINNKGENNPNLGKILTKETRKKISESLKLTLKLKVRINNKPKKVGLETRKKLSLRSRGIPVKVFDESNNLVNEFPSIRSVARHFDISYKTVGRYLNKDVNYGEYKFKSFIKDV
jgi:group I intron endonuclease